MKTKYSELYKETMERMGAYAQGSPKMMPAFMKVHHHGSEEGALSSKYKSLIAIGISINAQCEGCLVKHVNEALQAGVSHDEIVETIDVAVYMGGGPAVIQGSKAFAMLQEFEEARASK